MAAPKAKRMGIAMDMTPMVDVAFLLLIFFMSTTQFKPPEDTPVMIPDSHSSIKLPDAHVLTITITKADSSAGRFVAHTSKVLMSTGVGKWDQDIGLSRLNPQSQVYRLVHQDKDSLAMNIRRAQMKDPIFRIVIKADKEADYATVEDIMDVLQKNELLRFHLVTDLKKN